MDDRATTRIARGAARIVQMVATLVLATTLAVPVVAWASHQFTDVPDSNVFHADIDWMRDNGVTKGCNPPENAQYCPDDFVTREQMAAFMHRLESEGVFLPGDGKAADADTLDGLNSTSFAKIEEVAALSDLNGEFLPIATISVINGNSSGTARTTSHRRPVTSPPTSTKIADGEFRIDFPGIALTYDNHIASCTGIAFPVFVTYEITNGDLTVKLWDSSGALATGSHDDFTCVLYNS